MKIGVLYIALGRYSVMWSEFYQTARQHFFTSDNVHFYIFTDDLDIETGDNVTIISTKNYGWPGNTLYRFKMFLSISSTLKDFDYLFFFNANALFMADIGAEILPTKEEKLVSVEHFAYINSHPSQIGYDRNKKSTAYVPWKQEPSTYFQACLIGGEGKEFLNMCEVLAKNIDIDDKNGVCARWHDESHFNHYLINKTIKVLPKTYALPEFLIGDNMRPIIKMRDKQKYANLSILRKGRKQSIKDKVSFKISNLLFKLNCFVHKLFWKVL